MYNAGDFTGLTETVHIPFNTFSSDDPSASVTVTDLADTDIHIHKDGSATQRASASGVSVAIDYDTITGNHLVSIDLSNNTDAGFFAAGSRYAVRLEGVTIDGATVNAWIGGWSIGILAASVALLSTASALSVAQSDLDLLTGADGATLATLQGLYAPNIVVPDPAGLLATLSALTVAQNDLDLLTGADGATLATLQGLYAPNKVVPNAAGVSATASALTVAQADLTTITGADGVTLASLQGNYAPNIVVPDPAGLLATASAMTVAQTDLDTITGTDGVTLATAQGLYAPNVVVPDPAGLLATASALSTAQTGITAIQAKTDNLPEGIQKNQAYANFEFLMVDETDYVTPETGKTVTGQRSIDGGAFTAVTGTIAEVGIGIYQIDLATADTNGDVITYAFSATGCAVRYVTITTNT